MMYGTFVTDDDPPLTADQAAHHAGMSVKTWRSYLSRGWPRGNPVPQRDGRDPETGHMIWRTSTVDAWLARRPGPGARTDKA